MDLELSPEDVAFRDEVRQFIADNLPEDIRQKMRLGQHLEKDDYVRWQKLLHKKGWMGVGWPTEHGGPDWSPVQRYIFEEETGLNGCPRIIPFGLRMVGPVIIAFGTEEQKARHLPKILSSEVWWCQGYSEPGAGSDLASLKTRAVRDNGHYVVNGQKTWTTLAQYADWIFCLVRTDEKAKKQEGISFLLIDMKTPGVTVKPIITLDGGHEVNEVFFDDVKVPVENLVGPENEGWTVAKFLLGHERTNIAEVGRSKNQLAKVKEIAAAETQEGRPLIDDPRFREKIANVEIDLMALDMTLLRIVSAESAGRAPGPEASLLKIRATEVQQAITELLVEAIGYYANPYVKDAMSAGWNEPPVGPDYAATIAPYYFNHRKASIYGGSNEVQRGIIAKMVLGFKGTAMQFALTDEQRMLQDSVDRFIERDYDFEHRRALIATDEGFSDKHWKTFAELGWLGVPFSEEQGGYGGGLVEAGLILEGFGRGLVVEPYLWTVVLGGGLLSLAGRDDLLAEVIAGDLQLAFAVAEPQSRYDLADVQTRAERDGGGYRLTGQKAVVFNAPAAGRIIVPARTAGDRRDADGISLFLVDPSAAGVSLRGYPTVDGLRAAEVALDGVSVGDDALLGTADQGYPLIETVIDRATAAVACEAAGIMQTMVASTQDYLKTRQQFGVPLAKFQVLQHRMAELFIHKEQAQSMAYMAVVRAGEDDPAARARAASAAKTFVGDKGRMVGQESIQMHGGMGVTDEMPISHYFKRLTMIDTLFGNADFHRRRFAGLSGTAKAA